MKANSTNNVRISKTAKPFYQGRSKIKRAEDSYNKMWKEIKPFVKKRSISHYSTAGKWKVLSD